jgi:LPXTG-motif cell wall-anchored protein
VAGIVVGALLLTAGSIWALRRRRHDSSRGDTPPEPT